MRLHTRVLVAAAVVGLAVIGTACGSDKSTSVAGAPDRTIEIAMTDNAYSPKDLRVTKGETVMLKFTNNGTVTHEAILGDDAKQEEHHEEMTASTAAPGATEEETGSTEAPGSTEMDHTKMNHGAADADSISVEPGKTGELTHTFTESGTILIGCHEPGHWEAGMKANVTIG